MMVLSSSSLGPGSAKLAATTDRLLRKNSIMGLLPASNILNPSISRTYKNLDNLSKK
jgi:hypothetical protein